MSSYAQSSFIYAANALSKSILEEAERMEEEVKRLFIDFDVKKIMDF